MEKQGDILTLSIILIGVIIAIGVLIYSTTINNPLEKSIYQAEIKNTQEINFTQTSTCITTTQNKNCFNTAYADTPEERTSGLMGVGEMKKNEGMIFVFDSEELDHGIWMKNTFISLDLVWINEEMIVVDLNLNREPCINQGYCPTTQPTKPAKYVLEINTGMIEETGIKLGDGVEIIM